ncbi:MAG: RHS repeat-associated core domain-containing protein [Verrucomicrobiia bacterium]
MNTNDYRQRVPGKIRRKFYRLLPWPLRVVAWLMVVVQAMLPCWVQAASGAGSAGQTTLVAQTASVLKEPPPAPQVTVNRRLPAMVMAAPGLPVSESPTDAEIMRPHIFAEPLAPIGKTTAQDNRELTQALATFLHRSNGDDDSSLTQYLADHPQSPWRASLLADLGVIWLHEGRYSKALAAWQEAWQLAKDATEVRAKTVADRTVGELLNLDASLGRQEELGTLLNEIHGRKLNSAVSEKIAVARDSYWLMQKFPERTFRCGPMALSYIRASMHPGTPTDTRNMGSRATSQGLNLSSVCDLANQLGLNFQMARRLPGSKMILPAVVHWKVGHYAALIKMVNGKYVVQGPTTGGEILMTQSVLDSEASGNFLVPAGDLPQGWNPISAEEGKNIWGKGQTIYPPPPPPPCTPGCGCPPPGPPPGTPPGSCPSSPASPMAQYYMQAALVSLYVWDTPIGYIPPRGMDMHLRVSYDQRDTGQPSTFQYSNFGQKWTFNWLSYITDDPNNPGGDVTDYMQGGGTETYSGINANKGGGVFAAARVKSNMQTSAAESYSGAGAVIGQSSSLQPDSQSILTMTSPGSYTCTTSQGYKQIYSHPDGAKTYPRNIFLTQVVDPSGNTLTFTYDGYNRIVAVTDAIGQVTTLSYGSTNIDDPLFYEITRVTDPFGRSASFTYNAFGQLVKITDVIGITSQFTYGWSDDGTIDFLNSLTTPYGRTTFAEGTEGLNVWLEATDPMGQKERMEYDDTISGTAISDYGQPCPSTISGPAPAYLVYRNTFYWDKQAMQLYPGDYTKARIFHWLHEADIDTRSSTEESTKSPLEGRIWYTYPGQAPGDTYQQGTDNSPAAIARVLDDGTSQITQYQYNGFGNVVQVIDPAGRVTTNTYADNQIDLLTVQQQDGANFDTLASYTYNANHLPLTTVDAAGQTNFFAYNNYNQLIATTNALGQVTTMAYDANGYLTNITGALPGATTSYTYDGCGRVRTVTDSLGYTITTSYDAADRPTNIFYPDGTYRQIVYNYLDPVLQKDRDGHWLAQVYDPLRHLTDMYDNLGRHTHYEYCTCGALNSITDPLGRLTTFLRDLQNRVTSKIYPDGTALNYAYQPNSGRLQSVTDAKGQTTEYQFFIDNNLAQVSYTNAAVATPSVSFTYDTNYNHRLTMTDGIGTTAYSYYAVTSGQLGAGQLQGVDGPFANDTIAYNYDALGRVTSRAINGMAQQVTYDALGRETMVTNALGSFTKTYVGTTLEISTNYYPNGQQTVFSYFNTPNDERLAEIWNQNIGGGTLSKFDYGYDAEGQITNWTQQADAGTPTAYTYQYDAGKQLINAVLNSTGAGATVLKQYAYGYDQAGNRTSEAIVNGTSSLSVTRADYNNLNQLTNLSSGGGLMQFAGALDKQGIVTVAGNAATVNHFTTNFVGYANVSLGTNLVQIVATDYNGNARTNNYQLVVTNNGVAEIITYDLNGNETSVVTAISTNTYQWDAANRLMGITQLSTNNTQLTSLFAYDGLGRRVQIIELQNGVAVSTNTFLWDGQALAEQRDNTGANVVKRFFGQGEQISGANYYFTRDHLGSVREMTDSAGTIRAQYDYDPYGRQTRISGTMDGDFGYAGYFAHQTSGLFLTLYRVYDSDLGRWLSRDPIGEVGIHNAISCNSRIQRDSIAESKGANLYEFVANNPINKIDPLGLKDMGLLIEQLEAAAEAGTPGGEWVTAFRAFGGCNGVGIARQWANHQHEKCVIDAMGDLCKIGKCDDKYDKTTAFLQSVWDGHCTGK